MYNMQRFERMAKTYLAQDGIFWDDVKKLIAVFVKPVFLSYVNCMLPPLNPGKPYRLACSPVNPISKAPLENDPSYNICLFFACSPQDFVPVAELVCSMTPEAVAFGERELLGQIIQCCFGTDRYELVSEIARKIDKFFRQGDDIYWKTEAVEQYNDEEKLQSRKAKAILDRVYSGWVSYIKRHYSRAWWGKRNEDKVNTKVKCLNAVRNYRVWHNPRAAKNEDYIYNVEHITFALKCLDRTLYFAGGVEGSPLQGQPVVLTDSLFRWMADTCGFSPQYDSEIREILRLEQSYYTQEELANRNNSIAKSPCFSYYSNLKVYDIFFHKGEGKFTFVERDKPKEMEVAKKSIVLGRDFKRQPLYEYFYHITGGNWDCFCSLAKNITYCVAAEKLFPGVLIIPKSDAKPWWEILYAAKGYTSFGLTHIFEMSFLAKERMNKNNGKETEQGEMTGLNSQDTLIQMKIQGESFAFCNGQYSKLSKKQKERIKKIFSGATVSCSDPILKKKQHKNMMQWLVYGDDLTVKEMTAAGIKYISVSPFVSAACRPEPYSSKWLQCIVPLWGYLQIKKRERANSPGPKMNTVAKFIERRCFLTSTDGEFMEARKLYEHYKEFCTQNGFQDVLLFKDFNDVLEQDYALKRSRHHTTKANYTGYRRIRIKSLQEINNHKEQIISSEKAKMDAFFERLDEVEREVREHFPDFPFDMVDGVSFSAE